MTAEKGDHFDPTVGSVTPNRFTTSHPWARPWCFEIQSPTSSLMEVKDEGYSPYPMLITLCVSRVFSNSLLWSLSCVFSLSPLPHFLSCLFSTRLCVAQISSSVVRSESFYRWVVHPHPLIKSLGASPPTNLTGNPFQGQRVTLVFQQVKPIWYWFSGS